MKTPLKERFQWWWAAMVCKVWARIYAVEAHLADHRGDRLAVAEFEQRSRDCEHELKLINFTRGY